MRPAPWFFALGVAVVAIVAGSSCGPTPNSEKELLAVTVGPVTATQAAAKASTAASTGAQGGNAQGGAGGK